MTGVTCIREDSSCNTGMLSSKMAKEHLGQRREEERVPAWDRTDQFRSQDSVPVKKHHHKHSIKHRYQLMETLGKGTYGKVKKAIDKSTGMLVAVKSIQKDKITDELDRVHLQREIEITALLKHEHIIQVFEVFESSEKIIIVMEYASNGELYDFINNKHQIPESEARRFFRQIVSAVHYCHKNGIVHRDIKLENILLDENLNVKLADFGLSNLYYKKQVLETYCGSPLYASPEIVKGLPYHGPEVDCWALGVLLYALIYGSMPFDNSNYKLLADQIGSGQYRQPPHLSGACGLIDWLLTVNPARRATIEDIANHWWVNWGYDTAVCDCHLVPECQSPLLARYIECQNTPGFKGTETEQSGVHLREEEEYEGCLRKSKKENDINQSQQELEVNAFRKKPKGILKKRSSFDSSLLNSSNFSENVSPNCMELSQEAKTTSAYESHISTDVECTFNKPKKGILKKTYERESGYSSSPERITTSECQKAYLKSVEEKGRSDRYRRKKGILKKNGRFSTSLDLPADCSSLRLSDSMEDLIFPSADAPKSPSRPSSVISDDSFLSSDSFDILDMTFETKSQLFSYSPHTSFYSSEEDDTLSGKLRETLCNRNHK
ncbi:PREDICTED: NUAK family SNF1-like kinase 1 [Nanorana parkeri]|uniref:NUAK family SNF1-like kinase 1 n=1 Tax=Nanorana parkeri TaxID=125878 RepID=UPI000854B536|nr:PREDICTED: NUAK family SNF1-like kinase 1 [Nanorana parkeri]